MERFNVEDLKIAELRCFANNNIKLTKPFGYGVLLRIDEDSYVNILNIGERYPIFEKKQILDFTAEDEIRIKNVGEYNGNAIQLVANEDQLKDGACWLIKGGSFVGLEEQVTLEQIEDYVLNSELFFKDRMDIAKDRLKKLKRPVKMLGIIEKDRSGLAIINSYFEKYEDSKVKRK